MGFISDFKAFAMKGNVVDMAVGVIIGGAFGKIVSSIVADLIMPFIGLLLGGHSVADLKVVLKDAVMEGEEVVQEAVTWNYGAFLQNVIDFLIIALAIFFIVKAIAKMSELRKKEEEAPAPDPEPTAEEKLLTEIRDLMKNQQK